MRNVKTLGLMFALAIGLAVPEARAGIPSKVLQETTEFLMKKFGREVAEEGAERLTSRLASAVARHGDDVVSAVRKVGPKAINLVDDAGANAPRVVRLLNHYGDDAVRVLSRPAGMGLISRYGDDAARVLIKHQRVAEPVLERLGQPAVEALGAVGPQGGRRLAMMAGDLASGERTAEVLGVIGRHGDKAMDFIWRHKGVLAGGAALTAFLANPEPYLNGTADIARVGLEGVNRLADTVAESAVKPAVTAAGNVAVETASHAGQLLAGTFLGLALLGGLVIKSGVLTRGPIAVALRLAGRQLGKQVCSAVTGRK
jgi:hypothetical protein